MKKDDFSPEYRFHLKARISTAGYRTMTAFSKAVGVDISRISRIVGGWENPSLKLAQAMAEALGVTITELKDLL